MKKATKNAIGTFLVMARKPINGLSFISWRSPDNKHFYLAPSSENLNVVCFGRNPEHYEVTYTLLGLLDMIK